jgi:ABC-3C biological conflict system middle component
MILPDKHTNLDQSILGGGAALLEQLVRPLTVTGLWERSKAHPDIGNFGRFILTLDFLFAIGAVDLRDDLLVKGS